MSFQWNEEEFNKKLQALEDMDGLAEEITREIMPELKRWSDLAFVLEADDNDNPWTPLKKPRAVPPMLAGLKGTYVFGQYGSRIGVISIKPYALYHQYGTRTIPARRTLPGSDKIPASLEPAVQKVVESVCNKRFGE